MEQFITLTEPERHRIFTQTSERIGLPAPSIEKDFWVCWTLKQLFALPNHGSALTFKGGTSLSKVWKIIDRFSEDIDLTIDRESLGFGGENSPDRASTGAQRDKRLKGLRAACQAYVGSALKPTVEDRWRSTLPTSSHWSLSLDEDDLDQQTLLFHYPSCWEVATTRYVRPVIKMEFGAWADTWPAESKVILPFVAEEFQNLLKNPQCPVRVLTAERTFWEKAFLIHEETFRPPDKKPRKPRMARHYYDLWSMIQKGVAARAVVDEKLFERIAEHRQVFFRWTWVDYSTFRMGALRLIPPADHLDAWRRDYQAMHDMFPHGQPAFDEILAAIGSLERQINQGPIK